MTDRALDLDAIQARINGASPLPWTYRDVIDGLHNVTRGGWDVASCGAGDLDPDDGDRDAQAARNAEFVAHSRSDMELMAARIRELEAQASVPPAITGSVGFDVNTPPYVDLTLANGARVRGFVDDGLGKHMSWSNPLVEQGGR
ncbi:hypothetical protein CH276_22620 [Rhodococcus sp. 06-470-2]|uniref:hypothetical protein n=1 Tax=unclassified Rhodococcus (in: high G+C Gram-positive bacteria) TaxID=192944 RepID=UPI000B9B1EED|nr:MULTISPECIES: hypothetical protein [unclassified Rhodococcus (in: high G+C Gram-positive bacteria)]OZC59245.1 hypothetical protein CH276_22620 [Rhodococcus sp. 06-470-2]OZE66832.1 hypothetical protein CH265_07945 [Rhodococcus sp. 05-2221-1B]